MTWHLWRNHLNRLNVKLAVAVAGFMLLLLVTVITAVNGGLNRLQRDAVRLSTGALSRQGRLSLQELVQLEAAVFNGRLAKAADLTHTAAAFLADTILTASTPSWDARQLATFPRDGLRYDAAPGRVTDLVIPGYVTLDTSVTQRLAASTALDRLMPALLAQAPEAVAIYYHDTSMAMRYYPPIGLAQQLAGSPHMAPLLQDYVARRASASPVRNRGRGTVWDPPYVDNVGQGLMITANTPVYVRDEFQGIVSVDISLRQLVDYLQGIGPTPGSYAFLADQSGRLIAVSDDGIAPLIGAASPAAVDDLSHILGVSLATTSNSDLRAIVDRMRQGHAGIVDATVGGEAVWLAYAPLPDLGWSLGMVTPVREVTAPAASLATQTGVNADQIVQTTLALVVLFFLAALAGVVVSYRRVTGPIASLVSGTETIAAGDLNVTLPVTSQDELGRLAASFNRMTAVLRQTRYALQQQNRALTAEVADRQLAEAALRDSENRYRQIFETTSDGLLIYAPDGTVADFNAAAARMNGYTPEAFRDLRPADFIQLDSQTAFTQFLHAVLAGKTVRGRAVNVRRDGSRFPVAVHGSPMVINGQVHVLAAVRDTSEEMQALELLEQRVAERTRELTTLLNVSHNLTLTVALPELLSLILEQLHHVVDFDSASIFTLEENELVLIHYQGPIPQEALPQRWDWQQSMPNRQIIELAQPLIISDLSAATTWAQAWREVSAARFNGALDYVASWLGVPLLVKDRVVGMMTLDHGTPGYYGSHHARLTLAFANQTALAIENARLYEQAQSLAALQERQKLARELHDSVSQALYGIALGARTARKLLERETEAAALQQRLDEPLAYVLSLTEAGLAEMRALIFELRPESLATEGLVAALTKQSESRRASHQFQLTTDFCPEPDVPLPLKEAIYRVAQEALHNVIKHAAASAVNMTLRCEGDMLRLTVTDDGRGFDPDGAFPGHLGLRSMRERAERLGGCFHLETGPGKGARIEVHIPVPGRVAVGEPRSIVSETTG